MEGENLTLCSHVRRLTFHVSQKCRLRINPLFYYIARN